jgi:hypothetical protein
MSQTGGGGSSCCDANRDERLFQATRRDVAKALLLFRRTVIGLNQAHATREDGAVDREGE